MKKALFAGIIAAAMVSLALPVSAETFTSADGVLSIDLPSEEWKEMTDPSKWIALSDGSNMITIEHYSNGEKLPDMSVANENYVNVYQAVFSTQNEVFIITGSVVDAAKIPEIANAIISAKVLKFDTKMKIAPAAEQTTSSDFSVEAADKTMYVTSQGLNVRAGYSTDDQMIGAFANGAAVHVTGVVKKNGEDYGWYRIEYNGGAGYVASAYLSDSAPAKKEEAQKDQSGLTFTGAATTVYSSYGNAVTIYKATDGNWYDVNGKKFTWLTDSMLSNENGESYTVNQPVSHDGGVTPIETITVYWLNGNSEELTLYSDGSYYSSGWVRYYDAGGGAYAGADGTTLYSSMPQIGAAGSSLQHGLSSQGSGRPVEISSSDGSTYYDASGTAYYDQGDGTFVDSNGDVFNVEW